MSKGPTAEVSEVELVTQAICLLSTKLGCFRGKEGKMRKSRQQSKRNHRAVESAIREGDCTGVSKRLVWWLDDK